MEGLGLGQPYCDASYFLSATERKRIYEDTMDSHKHNHSSVQIQTSSFPQKPRKDLTENTENCIYPEIFPCLFTYWLFQFSSTTLTNLWSLGQTKVIDAVKYKITCLKNCCTLDGNVIKLLHAGFCLTASYFIFGRHEREIEC